jgi:hypothetical protein
MTSRPFLQLVPPLVPLSGHARAEECIWLSHLHSDSLLAEFFGTKQGYFNFCENYTIQVLSSKKD